MAKTKESILSNLCMDTSSNPLTKSYWKPGGKRI